MIPPIAPPPPPNYMLFRSFALVHVTRQVCHLYRSKFLNVPTKYPKTGITVFNVKHFLSLSSHIHIILSMLEFCQSCCHLKCQYHCIDCTLYTDLFWDLKITYISEALTRFSIAPSLVHIHCIICIAYIIFYFCRYIWGHAPPPPNSK